MSSRSAYARDFSRARQEPRKRKARMADQPWWPWTRHVLTLAFFALVAWFSIRYARNVDWAEVWQTILATPRHVLLAAIAGVAASYALYCSFDLLGRRYTGHTLPKFKVWQVNFISYAFNLNFGSLVGGVAFRYRLYSQLGLNYATVTRVLTLSMLTNWLGYLMLAGIVFTVAPLPLPPHWKMDSHGLQLLGIALLAAALAYLLLCGWSKRRSWSLRGHELIVPPPKMALLQLALSCANWMIMAAAVYVLLQERIEYAQVLSVLLIAAVAGVITHVPAGLGVLEAVFIALLSHQVPESQLLGALLGYRALYYIAPLLAAAFLYLTVEVRARNHAPAA